MRFFTDPHYARQALANSLIRVGESPVWVGGFDGWATTLYYPINGKTSRVEDIREVKKLNIEPVPLGYVNLKTRAEFISRIPRRRWKQGLSREAVSAPVSDIFLKSRALGNCILNRYPAIEVSILLVKTHQVVSSAFNREWAIGSGVVAPNLMFRGKLVGIWTEEGPKLSPPFEYLIESFEEARK